MYGKAYLFLKKRNVNVMGKKFMHVNNTKDGLCPPPFPPRVHAEKKISKASCLFFFLHPAHIYILSTF